MTVGEMIRQLTRYSMETQVVDTDGSPIMWMFYARPSHQVDVNQGGVVKLEPKSHIDIDEELETTFTHYIDDGYSDIDAIEELKERGFTLDDLKAYREDTYEWAINKGWND